MYNVLYSNFSYKLFVMNYVHFESSPDHEYPGTELDATSFVDRLPDKSVCGKSGVTDPYVIDCKTEDGTNLGEISSLSKDGLEREKEVRVFDAQFVFIYHERFL